MKLIEYLNEVPKDVITERLLKLFYGLEQIHNYNHNDSNIKGYFITQDMRDIEVNELGTLNIYNMKEFSNVAPIINGDSETENNKNWDIIELCIIGICAYNHIDSYYKTRDFGSSMKFINNVAQNIDRFANNNLIPEVMREYFIDVLVRGNYSYANDYYEKNYSDPKDNGGNNKGIVKVYATREGKAFAVHNDNEAAYVDVLLIPALIALIYIVSIITFFVFF